MRSWTSLAPTPRPREGLAMGSAPLPGREHDEGPGAGVACSLLASDPDGIHG